MPSEVYDIFVKEFINIQSPVTLKEAHYAQKNGITAEVTVGKDGKEYKETAHGNGRLNAVSSALMKMLGIKYDLHTYTEHAMEHGDTSKAVSYVGITDESGKNYWGVGIETDIIDSSLKALFSAVNNMIAE